MAETLYCIDTSSLIQLKGWRPPKSYAAVWKKVDSLIKAKWLIAPWKVFEELKHQDDALLEWSRHRKSMFRKTSKDIIERAQQ